MTTDLPLSYRLRSDLEWTLIQGRRRRWWVAKDPLRSCLFRCGDEVRRLLQSLDGSKSLQDLQRSLSQGATYQPISRRSIDNILRSAIQKQLLIPSVARSDSPSSYRSMESTLPRHSFAGWLRFVQQSPWSMIQGKHRIGNAEAVLKRLAVRTDWLFSTSAVRFWIAIILTSTLLVATKAASENLSILPSISAMADQTIQWLVILLLTRIAHEMGHAIVCVRMGAACREYGLFIMLGVACPYVDVTDSWRLPNPRDRMAIAAAGLYVEWIIAAIAGFIWYSTQPSWFHSIAWQVMVVCSLTTLLINANPLMRYDGYFLLCDYLESVNLREESDAACSKLAQRWWLGNIASSDELPWSWRDGGLLAYACMSWIYRCCLVVALVASVHAICLRWQLPKLGWAFGSLMFVSFLLIPMSQKMLQSWSEAYRSPKGPFRLVATWLGCVALVLQVGWLPIPHRIACQGSVQPESRTVVYTQAAGRIPLETPSNRRESSSLVLRHKDKQGLGATGFASADYDLVGCTNTGKANGTPVFLCDKALGINEAHSAESSLLTLENPWIEDRARQAIQHQKQIECKIAATRMAAYQDPSTIDRLPALSTMAAIAKKQTFNALAEVESLDTKRPIAATWVPLDLPPLESLDGSKSKVPSRTIADPVSSGQWLPAGTPIGYVTETDRVAITATLPVSQLDDVRVGMSARVRFDQLPSQIYQANVSEISGLTATPENALRNQPSSNNPVNGEASDPTSLISIQLSVEGISQQTLGMGGTAEIVIWSQPKSLYQHIAHIAGATFGPTGLQTLSR